MSGPELLARDVARPVLAAEEEIASGNVPDARLYDVVLAVTGSEDAASLAVAEREQRRIVERERAARAGG